jgi:hypothetical protein
MLTLPLASVDTVTIFMPAMTAEAGLVPCALTGMMQMSRWASPLRVWWVCAVLLSAGAGAGAGACGGAVSVCGRWIAVCAAATPAGG